MIGNAIETNSIAGYTLIEINEGINAENETSTDGFVNWNSLKGIEGKICHRPNDWMNSLLNV